MLKKCLFLLFLSQTFIVFSQKNKKIDSLLSIYNNSQDTTKLSALQSLYKFYIRTDLDKSLKYAQEEITLASKLNDNYFLFLGNFNLGEYYYLNEKRDTARTYLNKALAYTTNNHQLKNDVLINSLVARLHYYNVEDSIALNVLDRNLALQDSLNLNSTNTYGNDLLLKAMIYQIQDNIEKQLSNAQRALKVFEANNNQLKKADALRIISGADVQVGDLEKGLERELKALEIYRKHHDKKRAMVTLSRIGSLYVVLDKRPLAKKYFEEVLHNAKEQNLPEWQAIAYDRLGGLDVEAGKFDTGIELLEKGVDILRKNNNKYTLSIALLNLGNAYYDEKNYKKAIKTLDECISISEKNHTLYRAYKFRSASYEALNNLKPALSDYKKFKTIRDSVWNIDKSHQIEELRTVYETEKKEQKIILQGKEIDLLKQKEKNNNLQRFLLAIGLILSLVGFYAIRQKLKRKKAEKEKLDNELEFKKKELTTHALHLARKNEVLESLKTQAQQLKDQDENKKGYQQLIRAINFDLQDDKNWENFSQYFEEVHQGFSNKAKQEFPEITSNDLRLMALIKMNLSSKEVANILSISSEGIKKARYRLRKKLNLSTEDSLEDFILRFA